MKIRFLLMPLLFLLVSCGSGGTPNKSENSTSTMIEGTLVDQNGAPLPDVQVTLFETYESSLTDERGQFSIESYKHLSSVKVFFKRSSYSNKVDLGQIADDIVSVVASFMLDTRDESAVVLTVNFQTTSDGFENPELTPTPDHGVTPGPTQPPLPGTTPTPKPTAATPTPKPSNFDSNGNTTAFGIPNGLKGNIKAGAGVWAAQCESCHAVEKKNRSYGQIKSSFRVVPSMQGLSTSTQDMANLTAYLNRSKK